MLPWFGGLVRTSEHLLRRHRAPVVLGLCLIAGLAAIDAVGATVPRTAEAVVVVRDAAAGTTLTADHVALQPVDADTLPTTALRAVDDAVGRRLAVGARTHELLTHDRLVVPRAVERSGAVLAAVRLADAEVAGLLATGDRVDVIAANAGAAAVVAENVRVAAVPIAEADPGGWLDAGPARRDGLVVVEVLPDAAARIAGAAADARLSMVLRSSTIVDSR
jgi:Flp pilus assembly protein CpaB